MHRTWPRSISFLLRYRAAGRRCCRRPQRSPAVLRNISMPVTTVFLLLLGQADDLHFVADLQLATLHTAGGHGAAAGDGEHVLNRHQEGQVGLTVGGGDIARQQRPSAPGCRHSRERWDRRSRSSRAFRAEPLMMGMSSPGNSYLVSSLADFHLDQLQQLLVVHLVAPCS